MNKKGFSLTEILVALGLMGILGSIATVSYNGFILSTTKRALHDSARSFISAVNTCITVKGGWEIKRLTQYGELPADCSTPSDCIKPCLATTEAELKKKLNYACPPGATCSAFEKTGDARNTHQYYCLSIEREVSGKKIQVLARVQKDNPGKPDGPGSPGYQVLCGEVSDFVLLTGGSCKKALLSGGPIKSKDNNPLKDKDNNKIHDITKVLKKPCEWSNPPS